MEWEELTISDNFMFQKVMQNPRICKRLIEKLLSIKIKRINYPDAEKSLKANPAQKGVRLDLYVETDEGSLIDIEMQTTDKSIDWLPKRARYYQAMMDLNTLGKGKDYIELKKSFVIFICTFDPFHGNNRKIYTFENICREQETLKFGDDTFKIFLNTKGTIGNIDSDIEKFLAYVDGKTAEGDFTREVDDEVNRLKKHKETRLEYMTLMMELKEQRREGYDEGYGEGFDKATIKMVRSLVEKKGWDYKEAFDFFDVSPENRLAIEQSFKQN